MGCKDCQIKRLAADNDDLAQFHTFERDGYKCLRCQDENAGFELAHLINPDNWGTRWESDNMLTLCPVCHLWTQQNPGHFRGWMVSRLGIERYEALITQAAGFIHSVKNLQMIFYKLQGGF